MGARKTQNRDGATPRGNAHRSESKRLLSPLLSPLLARKGGLRGGQTLPSTDLSQPEGPGLERDLLLDIAPRELIELR